MEDRQTVRAVERALDILLCFADGPAELSLSEIAGKAQLPKSTVHRLIASLESKGFLVRDTATEHYRLGFRVWELAANLSPSDDPGLALLPEMERLRDQIGETVSLYIRDGEERIRIQAVQSNQAIRRVAPIGSRMPLYVGASGKVLLAFAEPGVVEQILSSDSWPSSLDKPAFLAQLDEIRKQGYATSVEEREQGASAVAAPIFDRFGKLVAALAVSGPSNRWTLSAMREKAPLIMESAARMGKMLR